MSLRLPLWVSWWRICLQCQRPGFDPWGWEDSSGEGKGYPLQYSGLENSMGCIVHGVAKSRTGLSDFHFHPGGSVVKNLPAIAGDSRYRGSIPGLGRSRGEGKGYPLQYSGLENSMGCMVHGVTKNQTRQSDFHFHFHYKQKLGMRQKPRNHSTVRYTKAPVMGGQSALLKIQSLFIHLLHIYWAPPKRQILFYLNF